MGNLGSTSTAMRAAPGRNSSKSPSRFAASSTEMKLTPVTLPPSRLRLATRPSLTGLQVQYVVGGYMAVLTWWLDGGAKLPPHRIDAMFRRLATEGIM
jgi:hypothetical protein